MIHDDYISEGYALEDSLSCQTDRLEIRRLMSTPTISDMVAVLKMRYMKAKEADKNSDIECPVCLKKMVKTNYNKIFCSNSKTKVGNCKDIYWDTVNEKRRHRAIYFKKDI